ncbi:MAG: phosphoribosylglycinamide formyltransferase [Steroidobacteraceae bacterium]
MPAAPARRLRLAVLISGRGSNLLAIARASEEGRLDADVVQVVSDVADAGGLAAARELGIEAIAIPWTKRVEFEAALARVLAASAPDLVVLAGFMRVLSADFVERFAGRMLNIHPSLLPAHKGLHTHERALAAGDAEHGASVHLVTAALDGGPLLLQARIPVLAGDTPDSLSARVQRHEHIIYPQVIQWIAEGRLTCTHGQPRFDGAPLDEPLQQR